MKRLEQNELEQDLRTSAQGWKDFFQGSIWQDIQMVLLTSKDEGVADLRDAATPPELVNYVRGKLDAIDEMLNLETAVKHWLSFEQPEESED